MKTRVGRGDGENTGCCVVYQVAGRRDAECRRFKKTTCGKLATRWLCLQLAGTVAGFGSGVYRHPDCSPRQAVAVVASLPVNRRAFCWHNIIDDGVVTQAPAPERRPHTCVVWFR